MKHILGRKDVRTLRFINGEDDLVHDANCEDRIDAMNTLAWKLRDCDAKRAYELSESAYHLSHQVPFDKMPYLKGKADSLSLMGYLNHYKSNYDASLSQSFKALEIFEKIDEAVQGCQPH